MNLKAQVFFPASRFDSILLQKGSEKARELGIDLICPALPTPNWFQCATLKDRLDSIRCALAGPAEILWASRGGYGTAEWLSELPEDMELWREKRVVGFSDLTALHAWTSNRNLPSYHAPMVATRGWAEASKKELQSWRKAVLEKAPETLPFSDGERGPLKSGRLIGGNLTVLASLMGSPHQLEFRAGDLLFLEDIQEPPYRLARSLFQLSHSPHFRAIQIIWGQLTDCGEEPDKLLISRLMKPYDNPWAMGLEVGHGRPNYSIRLGVHAQITKGMLEFPSITIP
jgi:muramoyltetrapeptide carboxypeptidase